MQGIGAIVARQLKERLPDMKLAPGDPIGKAANGGAEVELGMEIRRKSIEAENDIIKFTVAVGRHDFHDGCAIIHDADTYAVLVAERVECDQLAQGRAAKRLRGDQADRISRFSPGGCGGVKKKKENETNRARAGEGKDHGFQSNRRCRGFSCNHRNAKKRTDFD